MRINRQDTNGVKPLLAVGELGYDNYPSGGDIGRVYVGDGTVNIALAKKSEVDVKVVANVDITAGTATKVTYDAKGLVTSGTTLSAGDIPVLDAGKITTGTLPVARGGTGATASTGTGDVVLSTSPVLVAPTIGVAIGTSFNSITGLSSTTPVMDGTATAGTGVTVARADHVHPKDTTKVDANANITAGTYKSVTVDVKGLVTGGTNPTTLSGYGITDADTSAQVTTKINNAVAALVDTSPTALDTLNELAAALGDDPSFATTVTNSIGTKISKVTSTDNAVVRFDGTTGVVQNSGVIIDDNNNVGIGTSSPIGKLHIVSNVDGEAFRVQRAGGTNLTLLRVNINESSNTATIEATAAAGNSSLNFVTAGYERLRIDSTGNVLAVSPTGVLGYGNGSGGTVTQLTSKSTTVTLNKPTGQIVMNNAGLGPGAKIIFIVYNNLVTNKDIVVLSTSGFSDNNDAYTLSSRTLNGLFTVRVINTHSVVLADPVILNFAIIKGANS